MAAGARQRSRDTLLELRFRRALRRHGVVRYRTHHTIQLPPWGKRYQRTTPDVVLLEQKIAVYLDGCFWHGCRRCYAETRTNAPQWRSKRAANRARDERHSRALVSLGWRVFRMFEHEDVEAGARAVRAILDTDPVPGTYGLA